MSKVIDFKAFKQIVHSHGLKARDCGSGHWKIEGGKYEVNWWPNSRRQTIYVNGLSKERTTHYGNLEEAIRLANSDPAVDHSRKSGRKKSYKRVKNQLLRRDPRCHWCSIVLTKDTATVDHLISLIRGGSNADDNLVLACEKCNREKGSNLWDKK